MVDNKMTRKASDAAIERVAERWGQTWCELDYGDRFYPHFTKECDREQALSDALRAYFGTVVPDSLAGYVLPVVFDPIAAAARRICAVITDAVLQHSPSDFVLQGDWDSEPVILAAIAELRAIAAQGGERG